MSDDTKKKEAEETNLDPNVASAASGASAASPAEEYLAGWKRALADYDNLKKDLARERGDMRRASTVELLIHLLPVMNNFEQATKHRPHLDDKAAEAWVSGILMIKTQMENSIKELGAEPFDSTGEKFNPEIHESVARRIARIRLFWKLCNVVGKWAVKWFFPQKLL